jgi:hypothetical protein
MTIIQIRMLATTALIAVAAFAAPAMAGDTVVKHTTITTTKPAPAATIEKTTTISSDNGTSTAVSTETVPAVTRSETKWKTEERAIPNPNATVIDFMTFDLNKDGVLSTPEVGERLFKMYDTDGNEILDNIEFDRKAVLTVAPMEKETVITYDIDGDGTPEKTDYTYETFVQYTQLARFDANRDGLSPHEFTNREFIVADINNDKAVDMTEWKASYIASLDKKITNDKTYNQNK